MEVIVAIITVLFWVGLTDLVFRIGGSLRKSEHWAGRAAGFAVFLVGLEMVVELFRFIFCGC